MVRYFFDIHEDSNVTYDAEGTELANTDDVRQQARSILPDVAKDEVPRDGDKRNFAVLVTDEEGQPVYSATLSFVGLWLLRA